MNLRLIKFKISFLLFLSGLTLFQCKDSFDRIDFPIIRINQIESISLSAISVSGELEGLENGQVSELGFVSSTVDPLPALNLVNTSVINIGASFTNTSFSTEINDLIINTTYFVRAYFVYEGEAVYSDVLEHRSSAGVTVENLGIKGIRRSLSAEAKGAVYGLPEGKLIEKFGHCWSTTNPEPSIADFSSNLGNSVSDTIGFISLLGNLETQVTYYIRPFAIIDGIAFYGEVQEYEKGDLWIEKGMIPEKNFIYATTFQIDNKAYVIDKITQGNTLQELWEYNPEADQWTYKLDFPPSARFRGVGFSHDGKGYIGSGALNSGSSFLQDLWEYDPEDTSNGLDENGNPKGKFILKGVNFPGPERIMATAFSVDERIFFGLGRNNSESLNDFYEYLPDDLSNGLDENGNPNGAWQELSSYPGSRRAGAEGLELNGWGYIFSGEPSPFSPDALFEVFGYNPTLDEWIEKTPIPEGGRTNPNVFVLKNKIYLGLGSSQDDIAYWELDLENPDNGFDNNGNPLGVWNKVTDFAGISRNRSASFQIADRAFVFSGEATSNNILVYDMWEYIADD